MLVLCSRNARPEKGLVRRAQWDQHGSPSKGEKEVSLERSVIDGGGVLLARGTRTMRGMEAEDLLCSRNARSRTPLVGRAQWKINQSPSLGKDQTSLVRFLIDRERVLVRCAQSRTACRSPVNF
jgi:hypothetical protein